MVNVSRKFLILDEGAATYRGLRERVMGAAKIAGKEPVSGWISIILYLLLSPGFWAYLQVSLNHIWEQEAEPLPGQAGPPPSGDEMPPRL